MISAVRWTVENYFNASSKKDKKFAVLFFLSLELPPYSYTLHVTRFYSYSNFTMEDWRLRISKLRQTQPLFHCGRHPTCGKIDHFFSRFSFQLSLSKLFMKSIYFDLINMPHLIIGLFNPPELIYRWSIPRKN